MIQRYVSKELTHLVGSKLSEEEQYSLLIDIIRSGLLTPTPNDPDDRAVAVMTNELLSSNRRHISQIVCFCDIPIDDLDIHIKKFNSPFGLSFKKSFLVMKGANPVFYIARNSEVEIAENDIVLRSKIFDDIANDLSSWFIQHKWAIEKKQKSSEIFDNHSNDEWITNLYWTLEKYVFSFMKFFDDSLTDDSEENYYMEREWRILGSLKFETSEIYRILLPESYAKQFREDVPEYLGQLSFVTNPH